MNVTSDFLTGLMTNYRAIFKSALDEAVKEYALYKEISTQFDSVTDQETYGWLGANPNMSEWKDKRQVKEYLPFAYTLKNKHYEGTIGVNRDLYEDDKFGMIAPRIKGLAYRAARHYNQVGVSQLDDGETLKCFDDGYFFANTRTVGDSGNIDNILAGAYSGSADEIRAAVAAAFAAMILFKDDKGIAMGLIPDLIVCSGTMLIPIQNALRTDVAGETRPEAGIIRPDRVFASPHIDNDTLDWYVLCTKGVEVKPLIFQLRKDVEFVALDEPKDENVFMMNTFYYGVDDRFTFGYGDPRTAIKIIDE